jgi:hypothetical protein
MEGSADAGSAAAVAAAEHWRTHSGLHQLQRAPNAKHPANRASRAAHAPAVDWEVTGSAAAALEAPG